MRTSIVLASLLALCVTTTSPTQARAEEDAPYFLKRPRVRRWKIGAFAEYRAALVGDNRTLVHGVDISYEVRPHLRVGGGVVLPLLSTEDGSCMVYPTYNPPVCTFQSYGLLGFAELHGGTELPFDPWIRVGLGNILHTSNSSFYQLDFVVPDLQLFASAGLDIHVGPVYFGGYGTISAFVGPHGHVAGGGGHLGARF